MPRFIITNESALKSLASVGREIPASEARRKKEFFSNHNTKSPTLYEVEKKVVDDFIKMSRPFKRSFERELAFRMYLGKSGTTFNIIIVPVLSLKNGNSHEGDLEREIFNLARVDFFALDVSAGKLNADIADCERKISDTDTSGVKLAFFSYDALDTFIVRIGEDYDTMVFEFARVTDAPTGDLTLVISCKKGGTTLRSGTQSLFTNEGVFFDEADLIPPHPRVAGTKVPDSHFNQTP